MALRPTPELTQQICTNVTAGMLPRSAAALAGIDRGTFSDWMYKAKRGAEPYLTLSNEIEKAALTAQRRVLAAVSLAATQDPKVGMQFLSMRYPEDWSERGREVAMQLEVESRSTEEIKALAAQIASKLPLLHWESHDEFEALIARLLAEHAPQGPTEEHLVEELASIHIRKGRLRQAEVASHRSGLQKVVSGYRCNVVGAAVAHLGEVKLESKASAALAANDDDTAEELAAEERLEAEVEAVVAILQSKKAKRYDLALESLGDRKTWWDEALAREKAEDDEDDNPNYEATPEDLLRFLQDEVMPWDAKNILILKSRPLVREQAFGAAFDAEDMEKLARIEAFLDRKFEKTLDRLLRIQELRRAKAG